MIYFAGISLACLVTMGFARAEAATYPGAEDSAYQCRLPIKADDLRDYAQNPSDVLRNMPEGGDNLIWRVRTIAAAGPRGLKIVSHLFRLANLKQKLSIGEGLARAASSCEALNSEVTTSIADMLRGSSDDDVIRAFTRFLSNEAVEDADGAEKPADPREGAVSRLPSDGQIDSAGAYFGSRVDMRIKR